MAGFDNDVMFAENVDFRGVKPRAGQITSDGQLLIGSTVAPYIKAGSLGSSDSSITWTVGSGTITGQVTGGSTVGKTITGNSGGALSPTAGNWNVLTSNSTVTFAGAASTLTQDFGLTNLLLGSSGASISSGTLNVGVGSGALNALSSGVTNTAVGYNALSANSTASANTAVGQNALLNCSTSGGNTAVGQGSLVALTTNVTGGNTALGINCLPSVTGANNLGLGKNAGSNYTGTESSNIVIASTGTLGESNTLRIGTTGSGTGQVSTAYMAGVAGVTVANQNLMIMNSSTGQMGSGLSLDADFTFTDAASGGTETLTISQTSNTASATAKVLVSVAGATAGDAFVNFNVSGVTDWSQGIDNSDSDAYVLAASTALGTTNVMRASTAGEINYPLQPAFMAYVNTIINNVTGDGTTYTIIYDTEVFDQGGDFNLATSTFTAPVTGRYRIDLTARLGGGTAISASTATIVTSNRNYRNDMSSAAGGTTIATKSMSVLADMDASDTFTVTVVSTDSGGKIDDITGVAGGGTFNFLSCNLVC